MVDYPIDITDIITSMDDTATDLYDNIVALLLAQNRTLSPFCKERLRDFSCASLFPKCVTSPFTSFPLSNTLEHLCKSFCESVVDACGGVFPGGSGCNEFNNTNCFTLVPSSRKQCTVSTQCDRGEYCYLYSSVGVCVHKVEER